MGYAAPIISPSTATVFVGNSITITSTDTITCALVAGSTGTLTGCVYTAPKSFAAKNNFDGCNTRPNDDIYNTRIDSLPVDSNSVTRISNLLGGTSSYIQFEMLGPHNVMSNLTPQTAMTFHFTPQNNATWPVLPLPYRGMENGAETVNLFDEDHHVLGVNQNTCNFYEMYGFYPVGAGSCPTCNSTSGIAFNGNGYNLGDASNGNGTTSDAAGMLIQPTELTYHDLKYGLNHALRFTLANAYVYSGNIWPAQNFTNECSTFTKCFPYGARLRLKNNFDVSSYSATTQVILNGLKKYGMIFADGGITFHLSAATDVFQDTVTYTAIQSEIRFGSIADQFNFEQVDESSLMVSSFTGNVNLFNGNNVVPGNFAQVTVTKVSDSSTATLRIALQPVTVGTINVPFQANAGALSVMAGTPQFQIPYVVNGATTTTAVCSISPAIGSITSGCLYTAPSTQLNYQSSTTLTITPDADHSQAITEPLVIFPSDGVRFNAGGKSLASGIPYDTLGNYGPDVNGNYWWSDPIGSGIPFVRTDGYYPQLFWGSSSDVGLYFTYRSGGTDGSYAMMVPNGYYILTLGFGIDTPDGSITNVVQSLDSQSSTLASSTTLTNVMGSIDYTPTSASYVVFVPNNQFYFSLRHLYQNQAQLINKWSLIPTTAPVFSRIEGGSKFQGNLLLR